MPSSSAPSRRTRRAPRDPRAPRAPTEAARPRPRPNSCRRTESCHDLATVLALSWALFALTIAIQFPLLIRFGYARISILGTSLPPALDTLTPGRPPCGPEPRSPSRHPRPWRSVSAAGPGQRAEPTGFEPASSRFWRPRATTPALRPRPAGS
ncbi:hypothetical protein SBRY_50207 [Actinacidiphila bryophytorum]|uniref:Uncharacterized protein n=1 Tax=Actinacidiphila bryophytorum TaxID=1436133 RepID=A0A9W4H433_9ACTN|nr:hypothetical protein SBRY_50207 [Actinacidiphila bryophytorum]